MLSMSGNAPKKRGPLPDVSEPANPSRPFHRNASPRPRAAKIQDRYASGSGAATFVTSTTLFGSGTAIVARVRARTPT